jgi:hypothetical protein
LYAAYDQGRYEAIALPSGDVLLALAESTSSSLAFRRTLMLLDDRTLVTPLDGGFRLWDIREVRTTEPIMTGGLGGGTVSTGEPGGFVSGDAEVLGDAGPNLIHIWNFNAADMMQEACRLAGRDLSEAEWNRFVGGRPYRSVCPQPANR